MKKVSLILVVCTLFLLSCANQRRAVALRAGVNFADVVGDDSESFEGKTDIHGGLVGSFGICDSWLLEPGLIYSAQGSDYSDSQYTGEYNLTYLNVPVMALYEVTDGLTLEAGPQLGFLLSAKDKYRITGESAEIEEDIKDNVKSIDFGVNLGAGYMITDNLKLSANYNLGLTKLADGTELDDIGRNWKNSVIQLSVSYYLKLGDIKGESSDD